MGPGRSVKKGSPEALDSDPDRTDKLLLKTQPKGLGPVRAPARDVVWPAPPNYECRDAAPREGEPCVLVYGDGQKTTGLLQRFSPQDERLSFSPENVRSAVTAAFS